MKARVFWKATTVQYFVFDLFTNQNTHSLFIIPKEMFLHFVSSERKPCDFNFIYSTCKFTFQGTHMQNCRSHYAIIGMKCGALSVKALTDVSKHCTLSWIHCQLGPKLKPLHLIFVYYPALSLKTSHFSLKSYCICT